MANVTIVTGVQNGFTKFGNFASPVCREAIPRIVDELRPFLPGAGILGAEVVPGGEG